MIEQVQKVNVCLKRESETSLFPKGLGDQRLCKSIGICIQLSKKKKAHKTCTFSITANIFLRITYQFFRSVILIGV